MATSEGARGSPLKPAIAIVIVSRNSRDLLAACLRSIESERDRYSGAVEVTIVDAGSGDGTVEAVRASFPLVRVLGDPANLGFTRGNNRGLRISVQPLLLLLNPDTELRPGALNEMARVMTSDERCGMVGPRLLNPDGSTQSSRRRFPTRLTPFVESTVFQRLPGTGAVVRRFFVRDRSDEQEQVVDWVSGACMLVRREALAEAGLFDQGFFMYSEEVDLCHRLRLLGWRTRYAPTAEVVHVEGQSSRQDTLRRDLLFHESRFRYVRKYFGSGTATLLRCATIGHFAALLVEEGAKYVLSPRNRALRLARSTQYRAVIGHLIGVRRLH